MEGYKDVGARVSLVWPMRAIGDRVFFELALSSKCARSMANIPDLWLNILDMGLNIQNL